MFCSRARLAAFAVAGTLALSLGQAQAQTVPVAGQIKSPHSGLCAEIAGGSNAPGARAVQQACGTGLAQQWTFQADPAGGHRLVNRNSALCLGVVGASVVQGTAAEQQACTGAAGQRWTIVASGANVELRNANSGQCLEIGGASTSPGASLSQWNCVGAAQQTWTLIGATPPSGFIVSRISGMCAHVPGASRNNGVQLTQWTCLEQAHLLWDFRPATPGTYQIVNRSSGLCLDVNGGSGADNAAAIQWPCGTGANQRFTLRPRGDHVEIVAGHSGKCIENASSMDHNGKLIQWTCNGGIHQQWTVSGPAAPSRWSAKISTPVIAVAASTLRNGKILLWSSDARTTFGGGTGRTYTALFDPATNASSERIVTNTGHDMFCPGTSTLADGRIMVTGGSGNAKVSIYDPNTNVWSAGQNLKIGRGYQGDTPLSTGDVFTVGGSWSGGQGGKVGEVWNRTSGWRTLPNVKAETLATADPRGIYRSDNHMWLFGGPNGSVFHAGPKKAMSWITTSGNGSIASAGARGDDGDAMNGNAVMYDAGRLLTVGGAPAYDNGRATGAAYAIDFSRGPGQPVGVVRQKPMAFPRAFHNSVVLPNGEVVVVGGHAIAIPFSDDRSMMVPELWSPATGAFTRLAAMAVPRNYHSVALLMLDGRVFAAGGGQCGTCATNHFDAEILTPPYLLNADGSAAARPAISSSPSTGTWGQTISVTATGGATSFAVVRLNAATHSVNNDQRRLPLQVVSASGTSFQLRLPSERGMLIPGDWMLFATNANGAPSVARIIRVQ